MSIFAPPPPPHVASGSRAASAGSAWLAPDSANEHVVGGCVQAQSFDKEIAPPPDGHPETTVDARELSSRVCSPDSCCSSSNELLEALRDLTSTMTALKAEKDTWLAFFREQMALPYRIRKHG